MVLYVTCIFHGGLEEGKKIGGREVVLRMKGNDNLRTGTNTNGKIVFGRVRWDGGFVGYFT